MDDRYIEGPPGVTLDLDKLQPRVEAMVRVWNELYPGVAMTIAAQPAKPEVHTRIVSVPEVGNYVEVYCSILVQDDLEELAEVVFGQIPLADLLAD